MDEELQPLLSSHPLPKSTRRRGQILMASLWTFLIAIALLLLPCQHVLANPLHGQPSPRDDSPNYLQDQLGAVASESEICSQIGIDLLNEGGNAADAVRCLRPSSPPLPLTCQ